MIDLISHYALTDMVTFVVLLSLAIKGAVEFWDWAWKRIKGTVKKSEEVQDFKKEFLEKLSETEEGIREMFNKEAEIRKARRRGIIPRPRFCLLLLMPSRSARGAQAP